MQTRGTVKRLDQPYRATEIRASMESCTWINSTREAYFDDSLLRNHRTRDCARQPQCEAMSGVDQRAEDQKSLYLQAETTILAERT